MHSFIHNTSTPSSLLISLEKHGILIPYCNFFLYIFMKIKRQSVSITKSNLICFFATTTTPKTATLPLMFHVPWYFHDQMILYHKYFHFVGLKYHQDMGSTKKYGENPSYPILSSLLSLCLLTTGAWYNVPSAAH